MNGLHALCHSSASCIFSSAPASCCSSSLACRSSFTTRTGPRPCSPSSAAWKRRARCNFGAVVTFLYFGLHVASLIGKAWKFRKALIARSFDYLFFGVGMLLFLLIIYAIAKRLILH